MSNEKISNNSGVLKIIKNYHKRKNKAGDQKMRKGVNRNETQNTSNMNTRITQAYIS